jgi:hypothetical protein
MPNDIPGFPTISIGGQTFFDIAGIVSADRDVRQYTRGLAIHHIGVPVGPFLSMTDEVQFIKQINAYHIGIGYGGFAYNGCGFASGRAYVVGRGNGKRAHVANRNHELEGFCMIGDFSAPNAEPPIGIVLCGGRWLLAKYRQRGLLVTEGHSYWATPGFSTLCPGVGGRIAIPKMMAVAVALARAGQ